MCFVQDDKEYVPAALADGNDEVGLGGHWARPGVLAFTLFESKQHACISCSCAPVL
jgi:hypothetical protein